MKQINVYFDDEDYEKLIEKKKEMSWNKFIMTLAEIKVYTEQELADKNISKICLEQRE